MRVLAVTTNASLVVALGSMMREWEVITVRDIEKAIAEAPGSAVALIDLGDSDAGIQIADQLYHNGITIPCVVVGDKAADDARAFVLVRPFSLEDLGTAVRDAASRPSPAVAPAARPAPALLPEPPASPVVPPPPPEPVAADGNGATAVPWPGPQVEPEATEPEPEPEPEVTESEPEVAPRLGLTVVHEADKAPELAAPVAEEPAYEPEPVWEEPEPEPAPQTWQEPAASATQTWEEPAAPAPPTWPEQEVSAATRPVFHEPIPAEPSRAPETSGRWKLRKRAGRVAPEPVAEAPLVRRLRIAAAHARELEDLIEQLPFLADLGAMAEGLIAEIDRQFVCAIASVSVRRDDEYEVVAHRGLSRVEAGMKIPANQSLFNDVLKTREGVLIQPVDLAQGLVAGIGGARTEALMVAPALVNDECTAIVVVGGDRFSEADLDRLSDLAAEAAPGMAVAQLLDRLRARDLY